MTDIQLAFEKASFTVPEQDSDKNDLVSIVKVDDRITEQELSVVVQLTPASGGDGLAENGKWEQFS